MAVNNCSVILEAVIKSFVDDKNELKKEKLSNEEKLELKTKYRNSWLEMAGMNGFDNQTISYLGKAKTNLGLNVLLAYLMEYQVNANECQSILSNLFKSKIQKDICFDLTLESISICLNNGGKSAQYLNPFIMFLPAYYDKVRKKINKENIIKYMFQILKKDADLSLIDLNVSNVLIKNDFFDLIRICLEDCKEEELTDKELYNFKKINEYLEFSTKNTPKKDAIVQSRSQTRTEPCVAISKEIKNKVLNVTIAENEWQQLRNALEEKNLELLNNVIMKFSMMEDEVKKLKRDNAKLEKNNNVLQTKLNAEIMAREVEKKILLEDRDRADRFHKQLEDEKNSKNFYVQENISLKQLVESKENMLDVKEQSIINLEEYIEKIKIEASKELQGSLNVISSKLKNEFSKYQEYLEVKNNENGLAEKECIVYLEHLLKKIFSVLKKNGINLE